MGTVHDNACYMPVYPYACYMTHTYSISQRDMGGTMYMPYLLTMCHTKGETEK